MARLPRSDGLLAALAHFAKEAFAPLDDSPKGVGPVAVTELLEGGLMEDNGKSGFRTTAAGHQVLAAEIPHVALARALWFEPPEEPAPSEPKPRPKPKAPIPAKKRKSSLLVTQKQVAAVMKGAAQAGVQVEVRIENGIVRFIPCEPEKATLKPVGVDKGRRPYF